MANKTGGTAYGPSWADVGELFERLQGKWGGAWFLQLTSRHSRVQRGSMSVVCKQLRVGRKPGDTLENYAARVYPHPDYATLCECMFKLLYELDGKLEQAAESAERQMTF